MVLKHINTVFAVAWIFVILVSVIDAYLLLQNRDIIGSFERNPLGNALLAINGGKVWLFLSLKLLGTILTSAALILIFQHNNTLGLVVALAVACFQFGLLVFLCCG
jgi:hypothetical protein